MKKKKRERKIESYPSRQLRLEDKTWEELKRRKLEYGKTWEKFISKLLANGTDSKLFKL